MTGENWVLHFETLEGFDEKIVGNLLKKLPIRKTYKKPSFWSFLFKQTFRTELNDSILIIHREFKKEWQSYQKEKVPYKMDFVVEDKKDGTLEFNTRLFHPEEPGNIFYGITIFKIDPKTFILKK